MENNSANRKQIIFSIIDSLLKRYDYSDPVYIGAEDLLMFNGYLWSVESNEYKPSIKDYTFDITFAQ